MARGRTKGASDKVPRKLRGGGARKAAVTEGPIFASSNNRRGNDTAMQRTFAAHFTAPAAGHHEVPEPETVINGPPTHIINGADKEPETGINKATPHILTGADNHEDDHQDEHQDIEEDSDENDEDYNDDSSSEDENEDTRPRDFCPELEKALAVALDMRLRKHEIHERLRKSHFLERESVQNGDWFNGKLKLRVRCCAPHLQFPDVQYTCVACNSTNTKLDGWTHGPRYLTPAHSFSTGTFHCPLMTYSHTEHA
jgi:hypothetical protein